MVVCLERDADLHMAQLMPLPLTISCFSKVLIGFTFLVPAHPGSPGQRAVKQVCVCVCVCCTGYISALTYYLLIIITVRRLRRLVGGAAGSRVPAVQVGCLQQRCYDDDDVT